MKQKYPLNHFRINANGENVDSIHCSDAGAVETETV
ncbi:MAG: hypothetical protein RLY14_3384 [Planctomycetota bacterium]|jgi:hypothetical protein